MGRLFDEIRGLVLKNRYLVGEHAAVRLEERGILEWQVVVGVERAKLLKERERSMPLPSVEVLQLLADGTEVKAVWSLLPEGELAKLVTVHFLDE